METYGAAIRSPTPHEDAVAAIQDWRPTTPRPTDGDRPAAAPAALFASLKRGTALIAICAVVGVALALAFVLLSSPRYTAVGRILVDPTGRQILGADNAQSGAADTSAIEAESQTYVLTSRDVLDEVIAREKLEDNPLFGKRPAGLGQTLLSLAGVKRTSDPREIALRELERSVTSARAPGSFIITVTATTKDAALSERIAQSVMDVYVEKDVSARVAVARRAGGELEGRLGELRARVRDAEQRYETVRREKGVVTNDGKPIVEQRLTELSTQLSTTDSRVNELTAALEQMRRVQRGQADIDSIPESMRSGTIETLRTRYAAQRQADADLGQQLGARHPERRAAAARVAEARRLFEEEIATIIRATTGELDRAKGFRTSLTQRMTALKAEVSETNDASLELRDLMRDVEANRGIYEAALTRSRELDEQRRLNASNTRVISRAARPMEPSGPPAPLMIVAGLLLGLGFGCTLAWLRDQLRARPATAPELPARVR